MSFESTIHGSRVDESAAWRLAGRRTLLFILWASCAAGQLTDRGVHPDVAAPFPTTAGSTFTEPVFGTLLVRITDSTDGNWCFTRYSYWPVFNADNSKVLFTCYAGGFKTYWKSFNPVTLAVGTKVEIVQPGDDATWSRTDPDLLFYHTGTAIHGYNVVSKTAIWTDSPLAGKPGIWSLAQMHVSKDDDLFSFHIKAGGTATVAFGVWKHSTGSWLYLNENPGALCSGADVVDEVALSQDGAYLYVRCDAGDSQRVRLSDGAVLGTAYSGHMDTGDDWYTVFWGGGAPYSMGYKKWDYATASETTLILLNYSTEYAAYGTHVSTLGTTQNWALVSMNCDDAAASERFKCDPAIAYPFQRELFMVATDGSGAVRRLVHHRADPGATCTPGLPGAAYRCHAFGALSFDENLFAFNSTDGHGGAVHVYAGVTSRSPITNVRVAATTATQAVISYTAPDTTPCSLEVSESAAYTPIVNDFDTAKFGPTADDDNREGSLSYGRERLVVIGARTTAAASDGVKYSRALQAATTHYFRITCGTETATGTFRTAPPPWGNTYPEIYPAAVGGGYAWPDLNFTAGLNQKLVDPQTGILFNSITQPGWFYGAPRSFDAEEVPRGVFDDSSPATWTIGAGASLPANWTGDGAHSPRLYIAADGSAAKTNFAVSYGVWPTAESRALDYVQINLAGGSTGTGENSKIQACLTVDGGVSCAAGSAAVEQDLTACGAGCTIGSTEDGLASWYGGKAPDFSGQDLSARTTVCSYNNTTGVLTRTAGDYFGERIAAGSRVWIGGVPYKVLAAGGPDSITIAPGLIGVIGATATTVFHPFGVLIWKQTTSGHQVAISAVSFRIGMSYPSNYWSGTDPRPCHSAVVQYAGRDGYHCQIPASGDSGLAWIDAETGETNLLGHLYAPAGADYEAGPVASFGEDANTFYGVLSKGGKRRLVRCRYTGDNSPVAGNKFGYGSSPGGFDATCTSLTPDPYDLDSLLLSFDSRYVAAQFPYAYSANSSNGLERVEFSSGQDNAPGAWVVMFDPAITPGPGANPIVAAYPTSGVANPNPTPTRGCTNYGLKDIGNSDWTLITANHAAWTNRGIFGTSLAADLPVGATNLVLTAPPAFDQYRAGDVLWINNTAEYVRVAAVTDPTHYTVERGYKGTTQFNYASGQPVGMWCKVIAETGAGGIWWKHAADPHAYNAAGTTVLGDLTMPGGYGIFRNDVFIHGTSGSSDCKGLTTSACQRGRFGPLDASIGQDVSVVVPLYTGFAGKSSSGADLETHASMDNGQLSTPDYFMDYHQVTGLTVSTAPTPVAGFLYKFTKTLNRKHVPTLALAGRHPLLDVSGPFSSITGSAGDKYKYCVVLKAGECYPGSVAGEVYFNVPYLAVSGCAAAENTNGEPSPDVCIGDSEAALGRLVQSSLEFGISGNEKARRYLTGFQGRYRPQPRLDGTNGKTLPDGRVGIYISRYVGNYQTTLFSFRLPGGEQDSVNRSTFVPVAIELGSVPPGTDNVVVEFGYDANFYCTSRAEACVANQATIDEAAPFYWASEAFSGLPCGTGCTVTIPALPQRVVYYRLKYRNSGNAVIAIGPTSAAVTP